MKKVGMILLCLLCVLTGCARELTNRRSIVSLYQKNAAAFIAAAQSDDFEALETISGVKGVVRFERGGCVEIHCGGKGFGSQTSYYGIVYSEFDDLAGLDILPHLTEFQEDGIGYRWQEKKGDNSAYVEPLGNHFYYYEAHF